MSVESDAKAPRKMFDLDPTKPKDKNKDSADYWSEQARAARAKREYIEENKMAERISNPEAPPEPPFKIAGEVNLGKIDIQEDKRLAAEATERARKEAQDRVVKAEQERDEARKALGDAQMAHLKVELGGKIDALQQAVSQNNRVDISEQLQGIAKIAALLGFEKPIPGPTDSTLSLEIKKLEWQMKKEDREFQRQMKKDEREWQIELKKLDQGARESEARLKQEKDKYTAFANIPERLGSVVIKGLADRAGSTIEKQAPVTSYHAEAGEGEAGEVPCPNCNTPIGIGPTASQAECINCHTKLTISRKHSATAKEVATPMEETSEFIT